MDADVIGYKRLDVADRVIAGNDGGIGQHSAAPDCVRNTDGDHQVAHRRRADVLDWQLKSEAARPASTTRTRGAGHKTLLSEGLPMPRSCAMMWIAAMHLLPLLHFIAHSSYPAFRLPSQHHRSTVSHIGPERERRDLPRVHESQS